MRRTFLSLSLVTVLALGYVQQRVWLIGLGYQVESLRHAKEDLLDQHRVLQYNVLTLQSPVILNQRLARRDVHLAPPQRVEVLTSVMGVSSLPVVPHETDQAGQGLLRAAGRLAVRVLEGDQKAVAEPAAEEQ